MARPYKYKETDTCAAEGCERLITRNGGRGWCSLHYERWRRTGTTEIPARRYYEWAPLEAYVRSHWQIEEGQGGGSRAREYMACSRLRDVIPMGGQELHRAKTAGQLSERVADRIATQLGIHMSMIWPEYWAYAVCD